MLKIAIFTEAGSEYGYGHLSRCTAIIDACTAFGFLGELFCRGEGENWESCETAFDNYDIIVIDSYTATRDTYSRASQKAKICVWLDDFQRLPYPEGIIHDCSNDALLRKEFWYPAKKIIHPTVRRVFVNLGSAPITVDVIPIIQSVFGKDIEIIKIHNAGAHDVYKAMEYADIAISAAGQTLIELACMGVASIAVVTAENQIPNATRLQQKGFCSVVTPHTIDNAVEYLQALREDTLRVTASSAGQTYINTRGALQLVADVLHRAGLALPQKMLELDEKISIRDSYIEPFWRLDEKQLREVLSWRNDETIRQWMFEKEPISWSSHKHFVENLKKIKIKCYWKVEHFGVISLSGIEYEARNADIGIYKAPQAPKGSGMKLLDVLLTLAFVRLELESVCAHVYMENVTAISLYERFGFRFKQAYERDKTVGIYELKREDFIV